MVAADAHSNGAKREICSNFCRRRCTNRNAASGFPPSDFRNNPTRLARFAAPSIADMAVTSFWHIEPPVDNQYTNIGMPIRA
jgi:hypothetical protein